MVQFLSHFTNAQKLIHKLKANLINARRIFNTKNPVLKELWFKHMLYSEIEKILAKIEYIKNVPYQLYTFLKAKQYVHCVHLLLHTLNLLVGDDCIEIKALYNMRDKLLAFKSKIQKILIDELHIYLYNKMSNHTLATNTISSKTNSYHHLSSSSSNPYHSSTNKQDNENNDDDDIFNDSIYNSRNSYNSSIRISKNKWTGAYSSSTIKQRTTTTLYTTNNDSNDLKDERTISLMNEFSPFNHKDHKKDDNEEQISIIDQLLQLEINPLYLHNPYHYDSLQFIQIIIQCLNMLNYIPSAQQQMHVRCSQEIQLIFNKAKDKIKLRLNALNLNGKIFTLSSLGNNDGRIDLLKS